VKEAEKGADKAFDADNAPPPDEGRASSPEERAGVKDTEMTPTGPLGVGESINARAEDIAREAEEEGRKGASGRPYGSGDEARGVEPQPAVTEGSPDLGPGDQGG